MRRTDVHHDELGHAVGVIEYEPMCDTRATVMADECELPEAEFLHHLDLIERPGAL